MEAHRAASKEIEIRETFPTALLTGFDGPTVEACLRQLGPELHLLVAGSESEALRLLGAQPVAVLALGGAIAGDRARWLLEEAETGVDVSTRINIVLGAGPDPSLFQDLIDRDRIFYLSPEPVPAADLIALLRSGAERWHAAIQRGDGDERRRTVFARRLLAATQAIASQRQPAGVARAAAQAVEEVVDAARGYCLHYDPATETLWEPPRDADLEEERRESAAVGLVSFVVRTGRPLAIERIGADPRFDREADDPQAKGDERFAAMPVLGPDGRILAVLAAIRRAEERGFDDEDLKGFTLLAEQAAPTFAQLRLADADAEGLPVAALFREEAVEHHNVGMRGEGDVLRVDPGWMRWTFRLLIAVLAAGLLFTVLAKVHDYAAGPAVVRLGGRSDLTANADGTVSQVSVAPGERVEAGRLLVRFYGAREAAELARIDHEFELQLINRLRDPADAGAQQALISLRAERELARSNLAERELRAPAAGVVSDIRVRVGQHIVPGQSLLSIGRGQERPSVVAFLPGEDRPLLKRGMPLRMEIQGYKYAYQELTVDAVGDEVVGPAEARRYLGDEIADAVNFTGPVVKVEAHLPSGSFTSEGKVRQYHDGMLAQAEVRIRSERVLVTLIPALKAFFETRERSDG
ncbi:MAG TPA: GAF domain-containing protein [Thermoanaerobaculia bacterium]|nr:GAF domain-containing protein [Thermoanaerobaculia bacterium]